MADDRFRTLVRVEAVDAERGTLRVVLPGWSLTERVEIPLSDVPAAIRATLMPGDRCYARVNMNAENPDDLTFDAWEAGRG